MLKKLAVPFLTLTLAAFGCSSSTTSTPGTGGGAGTSAAGGKGGGAAGSGAAGSGAAGSGAAGSGAAGSGAAGAAGGAAGSSAAGSGGGGKAGGGGGAEAGSGGGGKAGGGGGAGGKKADAGTSMADCTVTDSTGTDKLTAAVFCSNLFAYCSNISGLTLPSSEGACETMYNQSGQEHCRSYHLCWGVEGLSTDAAGNPAVHCFHTVGQHGVCTASDASTGN
jgi:hypothetical protein